MSFQKKKKTTDRIARNQNTMTPNNWIPFILTALIIPSPTLSSIQIHDITNNAGALILQRGEGRVIAGYDRLLHVIDFSQFEISILIIENAVNKLKNSSSDFSNIIKFKLNEIKFIFNTLNAKPNRSKRSINILGTAIKYVTGNLDADDLQTINYNLDKIRKSGNVLIDENNKQIKVNSKFENRLNLINENIRKQENILNSILKNDNYILTENHKISIIFQLDTFLENFKNIEYAILLAKVNIINKFVMTPKEIETIVQELKSQGLDINGLDDASSYMSTTVLHRGTSTIICVNIPRLTPTVYKKVIIEPLPLSNQTVKLTHKEVLFNAEQVLAITSKCQGDDQTTICERRQLMVINENPCETSILRGQKGQCSFLEKPPTLEIRMIAPGTLLVIAVQQDVPINSTCGIKTTKLTGIHLVTFQNCSLYIKNELFENYEFRFKQASILPLQLTRIKTLHIEKHVNLSALHELHLENRRQLETVNFNHKIGLASISTIIILIIALVVFGFIKYWRTRSIVDCSGRTILEEGLVKHSLPPASTDVESPASPRPTISTQTAESATPKLDTVGNAETSNITTLDNVTGVTSLLGARLAVLGKKAGQLGL